MKSEKFEIELSTLKKSGFSKYSESLIILNALDFDILAYSLIIEKSKYGIQL